jgi:segregation and condensation protein A
MAYKVKIRQFEGPFDLLVYLIENAEMSIYDIRVSEITEQYLAYIERMREENAEVGAEFLVLAATLIDIKSKMLLPRITADGAEEEDPRADLAAKLHEYMAYKKRAEVLEQMLDEGRLRISKPQEDLTEFAQEPDEYLVMDQTKFMAAFKAFIYRKHKNEELMGIGGSIARERMSMAAKKGAIRRLLKKLKSGFMSFRELLAPESDRYDKVVTFISVLEMVKIGQMGARQEANFAEIEVCNVAAAQGQGRNE